MRAVSEDRRLQYRVTATLDREVETTVLLADQKRFKVYLVDVSAGGVGFGVAEETPLPVEVGGEVQVCFNAKRLSESLEITGVLRHIKMVDNVIHYGVAFETWGDTRVNLTPKLRSFFNEREAVRVDPREGEEVSVRLVLDGKALKVDGLLRDVSILGVGIWLDPEDGYSFNQGDALDIRLKLQTTDTPLNLTALVRHNAPAGERSRVGLEFHEDQVDGFGGSTKRITSFVMARQMETARIDAERRRAMEEAKKKLGL
jgi:c-di-GMP-binding flagellar brake protein YcgR